MSTRTNIVVRTGSTVLYLYRHHDGYPSMTGADLATVLKGATDATALVRELLAPSGERPTASVYEITQDLHGDIEWVYSISFTRNGYAKIGAAPRRYSEDPTPGPRTVYNRAAAAEVTLGDFVKDTVNPDIRATNARLVELAAKNGFYKQFGPQQEVTL